ncbi:uncharacterized protein METZ01_LOCUS296618 [marine metagenome]|uniref:Uncharacterized protein n=1 Tax=marine metagenome TaxID=408172 RepID=A0A382M410_9ZZZZ
MVALERLEPADECHQTIRKSDVANMALDPTNDATNVRYCRKSSSHQHTQPNWRCVKKPIWAVDGFAS